jgi:hypothetical protein
VDRVNIAEEIHYSPRSDFLIYTGAGQEKEGKFEKQSDRVRNGAGDPSGTRLEKPGLVLPS